MLYEQLDQILLGEIKEQVSLDVLRSIISFHVHLEKWIYSRALNDPLITNCFTFEKQIKGREVNLE